MNGNDDVSLLDHCHDVPIASPVGVASELSMEVLENYEVSSDETIPGDKEMSLDNEALPTNHPQNEEVPVKGLEAQPSDVLPDKGNSSHDVNSATVESGGELRYISKYLVQFVPDARPQKKEQAVRISGARVLTSEKCAILLKEREEKKQKEKEEKEKRKLLREQKKKEKEEELKKKKAAAAEKKAAAAEKKAAAAAKRAAAEKKAAGGKKKAAVTEKAGATPMAVRNEISVGLVTAEGNETFAESEETRKRPMSSYTLRRKQARLDSDAPSCSTTTTTSNNVSAMLWQCSICYEDYDEEDTDDWVQCGCGRWTHELCITDVVIDASGRELFCPYCLV